MARQLSYWGHRVTVHERYGKPGGLMLLGIPPFRLPRDVPAREIEQICLMGVDIRCGSQVGRDVTLQELMDGHDAVVMATGALRPNLPDLDGLELEGVRHGLDFLIEANETGQAEVGRQVVVVGGGFTAVDCAGPPCGCGRADVAVYYRRSEAEMYITPHELDQMREEGILASKPWSRRGRLPGTDGRVRSVQLARTELGEPDASGRRRPVEVEGSAFDAPADTVLLATGQVQDTDWLTEALAPQFRTIRVACGAEPRHRPPRGTALFVAGTFASGADSLIDADCHARNCARDRWTGISWARPGWVRGRSVSRNTRSAPAVRAQMDAIPAQPDAGAADSTTERGPRDGSGGRLRPGEAQERGAAAATSATSSSRSTTTCASTATVA